MLESCNKTSLQSMNVWGIQPMHSFEQSAAKGDDQKYAGTEGQAHISSLFRFAAVSSSSCNNLVRASQNMNSGNQVINFLPKKFQSWLEARKAGKLVLFICNLSFAWQYFKGVEHCHGLCQDTPPWTDPAAVLCLYGYIGSDLNKLVLESLESVCLTEMYSAGNSFKGISNLKIAFLSVAEIRDTKHLCLLGNISSWLLWKCTSLLAGSSHISIICKKICMPVEIHCSMI